MHLRTVKSEKLYYTWQSERFLSKKKMTFGYPVQLDLRTTYKLLLVKRPGNFSPATFLEIYIISEASFFKRKSP